MDDATGESQSLSGSASSLSNGADVHTDADQQPAATIDGETTLSQSASTISSPIASSSTRGAVPLTVIRPRSGWRLVDIAELWRFRELIFFLAWRDVAVRYKQTLLGMLWAIVPPILLVIMFTLVFGKVARFPTGDIPYPLFAYTGLVPWLFFTKSLSGSSASIVSSAGLLDKVYFPRMVLPLAKTGEAIFDLCITLILLAIIVAWYGFVPGAGLLLVPFLLIVTSMMALGVGIFLAALNVSFRDIRHMIPFLLQIAMYATPSIYMDTSDPPPKKPAVAVAGREASKSKGRAEQPTPLALDQHPDNDSTAMSPTKPDQKAPRAPRDRARYSGEGVVPDDIQAILELNPMMGIVNSFRACILNKAIPWGSLAYSMVAASVLLTLGSLYFRRVESSFSDIL